MKHYILLILLIFAGCAWDQPEKVEIYRPSSYEIPMGHIGPGKLETRLMVGGAFSIQKKYFDLGPQPGGVNPAGFRPEKFTDPVADDEAPGIGGEGVILYYKMPF